MILEAKFEEDLEPVVLSYRSHEKLLAQNAEQFLKTALLMTSFFLSCPDYK